MTNIEEQHKAQEDIRQHQSLMRLQSQMTLNPPLRTNAPHGFGRHALCDLIGGEQQLYSSGGTAHHRRGKWVGEQVWPWALPQQVNERLRANCVATWQKKKNQRKTGVKNRIFYISTNRVIWGNLRFCQELDKKTINRQQTVSFAYWTGNETQLGCLSMLVYKGYLCLGAVTSLHQLRTSRISHIFIYLLGLLPWYYHINILFLELPDLLLLSLTHHVSHTWKLLKWAAPVY